MIVIDLYNCARCGEDHMQSEFKKFTIPIIDDDGIWTYWCMCPKLNEPILMKVLEDSDTSNNA